MKNNKYLLSSFAASAIISSALLMNGCGGGSSALENNTSLALSGIISDGPIFNAKVYIDVNGNGKFDIGEPMSYTKKDGSYIINDLASLQNGSTYYLVSEDDNSSGLKAQDFADNQDVNLSFLMFKSFIYNGKSVEGSIDPLIFKSELAKYKANASFFDLNISEYADSNETNKTKFFQDNINNQKSNFVNFFANIANNNGNSNTKLKTDLGLQENSLVKYIPKDTNTTKLSQSYAYKDQSTPAKIGSLVISLPLQNTLLEVNATVDKNVSVDIGTVVSEITSSGNLYDGNTTNPSIVLKKPIFAPTISQDNKVKVIIGKKSGLNDSITIFVSPYDNILQIPEYSQLKELGSIVLGADITVKGSNKKKFDSKILLEDANISGVILDGHKDVNASGLAYYYFNGTTWKNAGKVGTSFNGLNNKLMLAPYVLVDTNKTLQQKSVTIAGLDNIKDPVVIAKGKYVGSSSLAKKLFKAVASSDTIILDADGNTSANTATFKIPKGYEITDLVILGEEIPKFTSDKQSITVPVVGADITNNLSLITDQNTKSNLQNSLINLFDSSLFQQDIITKVTYSGDGALAKTLYDSNNHNFLDTNGTNTFVDGNITSLSWEDNATSTTYKLNVDKSKQELLYTQSTSIGTSTMKLIYSKAQVDKTYSYSGLDNTQSYYKTTHTKNMTVSYVKIAGGLIRADIQRDENKRTSYNEPSSSSSSSSPDDVELNTQKGYFIYDENETHVLSSNFKYSTSKTYYGSATGYFNTKDTNASFEGDFNINNITGHVSIKNATFDFINNNKSINNAIISFTKAQ